MIVPRRLLALRAPDALKKVQLNLLFAVVAEAFEVEAPQAALLPYHTALLYFAEFTAVCIEEASKDTELAAYYKHRLHHAAFALGSKLRNVLCVRTQDVYPLIRFLYQNIDIVLSGSLPGRICISRCVFSKRYSPEVCVFMSAFDHGIIAGVSGGGMLTFTERITQGSPCCQAFFLDSPGREELQ